MRRALLAAVPAVLACTSTPAPVTPVPPAAGPPPTAARPSLVGTYRTPHEIQMVCDGGEGWCAEKVEDVLAIRAAADGALSINVELVQTNAHTCGFEGTLAPSASTRPGTRVWRFQQVVDEDADAVACTLELAADATSITLTSDGCREYCGARAHLDASFSRAVAAH